MFIRATFLEKFVSHHLSSSEYKLLKMLDFIKVVSDTVLEIIGLSLSYLSGLRVTEKFVSHH